MYKREYASYPTILKDKIGQPDEFLVNLSRAQWEDIVEDFYTRHKVKGSKRLNVCLDKMKNEGVISEESYMNPQAQVFTTKSILFFSLYCIYKVLMLQLLLVCAVHRKIQNQTIRRAQS